MTNGLEGTARSRGRAARGIWRPLGLVAVLPIAVLGGVVPAPGSTPVASGPGVTEVQVTDVESPTFGGRSFGAVGPYEKLRGTITGAVDPADPRNSPIVDLSNAPRNGQGLVEYKVDFVLLRPVDLSRGNHRVVYEPTNRGNIVSLFFLNSAPPTNDPSRAPAAGNGFLMRQGYSVMAIAWDPTVAAGRHRLLATVPVAKNPDGSAIVGPALEEITYDDSPTTSAPLTYAAATLDKTQATLTVRLHYDDPPVAIAAVGLGLHRRRHGDPAAPGRTALPAERALRAHLPRQGPARRRARLRGHPRRRRLPAQRAHGQAGNPNPLAGDVQQIYTFCYSQPCRAMHDFVRLGFNQTAAGGRAVDGIESLVAGASGGFFNYRFAQPGRTMRQHIGRWYPERQFPFANQVTTDPVTGQTDGVLRRCSVEQHLPEDLRDELRDRVLEQGRLAADHRHPGQRPRPRRDAERALLPPVEPPARAPRSALGICQQPQNPLLPGPGRPRAPRRPRPVGRQRHRAAAPTGCRAAATARSCRRCHSQASASRRSPG